MQCSLADFRRLCILKGSNIHCQPCHSTSDYLINTGIYPREPRNKKKANKGSTAPTSFYYIKDIQYLLHEPVLEKLRQHKAFAKKLSRALGRGEYGLAKNLDQNKPEYRLDHIIKERLDRERHPNRRKLRPNLLCLEQVSNFPRLAARSGRCLVSDSAFCAPPFDIYCPCPSHPKLFSIVC